MSIYDHVMEKAKKAKKAAAKMPGLPSTVKDNALRSMADIIVRQKARIHEANRIDLEAAPKKRFIRCND